LEGARGAVHTSRLAADVRIRQADLHRETKFLAPSKSTSICFVFLLFHLTALIYLSPPTTQYTQTHFQKKLKIEKPTAFATSVAKGS